MVGTLEMNDCLIIIHVHVAIVLNVQPILVFSEEDRLGAGIQMSGNWALGAHFQLKLLDWAKIERISATAVVHVVVLVDANRA